MDIKEWECRKELSKVLYDHMYEKGIGPHELAYRIGVRAFDIEDLLNSKGNISEEAFRKMHLYLGETEEFWMKFPKGIEKARKDILENRLKKMSEDWKAWETAKKQELDPIANTIVYKYSNLLKEVESLEDLNGLPKLGRVMAEEYYKKNDQYEIIRRRHFEYLIQKIKGSLKDKIREVSFDLRFAFIEFISEMREIEVHVQDFLSQEMRLGKGGSKDLQYWKLT